MLKVFVTGAGGFVGKRLILRLLSEGHEVYALCRIKGVGVFSEEKAGLHYIWGDLRNPETLKGIPSDIDAAYYLVHSMSDRVGTLHLSSYWLVFINSVRFSLCSYLVESVNYSRLKAKACN